MVIVDSNIWIHSFRTPASPVVQEMSMLLRDGEVAMVGIVLIEVLQGARDQTEIELFLSRLDPLPFLEATKRTWIKAAELSVQLRKQGMITPLTDLVIAALALEGDHEVYTLDNHFQRIPGLKLYKVVATG